MHEKMVSLLIGLMFVAPIAIFIRQIKQVRCGAQRKVKATLQFFFYSIVPALVYMLAFAALVGIEELIDLPLVSEGLARTLFVVVGVAFGEVLFLTCVFALAVCCFRQIKNVA
jgi:hypothetical protein